MRETLCMGCMRDKGTAPVCPYCGYEEGTPQYAAYLPPRTMIDSRYLVGRVLSYNGEGVQYIGYDCMKGCRVDIREFFPDTLSVRDTDGRSVRVLDGRQIPFKANLGDFTEILGKLIRMRTLSCVVQVLGWVEANNTVYAVMEHVEGISLRDYLVQKGAMLTWQETADLLMPAMKTLSLLHQDGILHRGISADTVFVTPHNTAKIGGFAVSAVRAARTELAAELFPGYSAPEQYTAVNPHGPWTDVYAVCALLYTCLTGQRPPEALIRSADKKLMPPRERNETVPQAVSDAILKGLELDIHSRIQSMDSLISALCGMVVEAESSVVTEPAPAAPPIPIKPEEDMVQIPPVHRPSFKKKVEPEEKTAYYRPASAPATHSVSPEEAEGREAERRRTRKLVLNSMLIALPILLLALILTFWLLFGGRSNQRDEESSEPSAASEEWLVSSYPEEESSRRENSGRDEESSREESSREESSREESSQPESSAEESSQAAIKMENFVGQKYADVVASAAYKDLYIFAEPSYEYSDQYEEGYIIDQDVTPGLEVTPGTRVSLTVSQGSRYIELPSYEKQTMQTYTARLSSMGIPYTVVYRKSSDYPPGYVVGLSVSDNRYDTTSGAAIEVYVSQE